MPTKKTKQAGAGKRKMNNFMQAKEDARKNNKDQFEYKNKEGINKTYIKFTMPTGMVAYKAK